MQRRTYIAVTLVERWLMKWQPSAADTEKM
jgi:hypothetical protein